MSAENGDQSGQLDNVSIFIIKYLLFSFVVYNFIYGVSQKKWDLKKHGHNNSEIHQKGKKLLCFGKFCLNAAG